MLPRTWQATALAVLATFAAALPATASAAIARATPDEALLALDGEWLYVEDRTEDRPSEEQQPPMSVIFALRVEADAVVMVRGSGAELKEERITLDGSVVEVPGSSSVSRYRGLWGDGVLAYDTDVVRVADDAHIVHIRREFRATDEGLSVRVVVGDPAQLDSLACYRHPQDIPLPEPARGAVGEVAWLAGAWVGTSGKASTEERWSPALGGAMLGVSRTVSRGRMVAFEYLRIVERDGGLVYVAQPGGRPPTEFVLTELGATRAVFENPRHDSPQRIVYERSPEGGLSASIGYINGGRPQRFEFMPEPR